MNEQMQTLQALLAQHEKNALSENQTKQQSHFQRLFQHARQTVPFYKNFYTHLATSSAEQIEIQQLPILKREHIQEAGENFISQQIPASHGACYPLQTSGSTGKPVKLLATDFTRLFYDALLLREHAWHQRNLKKMLLSIRWEKRGFAPAPYGHAQSTWGPPINRYETTGPSVFMNVACPTASQIEGLLYYQPTYVLSYPSQLAALAQYCLENNLSLPFIEEVRATGETFNLAYQTFIKEAWPQVKISDVYSSEEVGYIAQQCQHGHYHVNIENCYLEIIDEANNPCPPHQTGRVLITSLLNYATPFIRYEIGDYAQWGTPCACGRGLPTIEKILGRKRNRLILPDGASLFPYLGERAERMKITQAIRKFQFVQHSPTDIEYKIVVCESLTKVQEEALKQLHQKNLGFPFNIHISYHQDIPAGPTGKYEEFISTISNN